MAKKEQVRWWTWKGVLFVATFLDVFVLALLQFLPVGLGWVQFTVSPWISTIFDFVVISFIRAVQLVVTIFIEFSADDPKEDAAYIQTIVEVSTCIQWFYFLIKTFIVVRHQSVERSYFWAGLILSYAFSAFELMCIVNWNEDLANIPVARENEDEAAERIRNRSRLLKGHGFLRIFSALHIIMYHICSHKYQQFSWISITFVNWGACHLTLFFILSGFVLAYQYYDKNITLSAFMFKRWARLYPLLWFSLIITLPALKYGHDYKWDTLVVLSLSIQTWWHKYMDNYVNWPSWTIGAFMFNYLIFPASLGLIKQASPSTRTWYLMPLFYMFTLWQTLHSQGRAFTVWYAFNTFPFGAHTPAFLIGVALGCNFVELKTRVPKFAPFRWFGVSLSFFLLLIIWFSVDFWNGPMANYFLASWSSNGMLAPLFCALIWFVSCETDVLMWWWERYPMNEMGAISFTLYITQNAAKNIMSKWYCPVKYAWVDPQCYKFFFPILVAIAMPCYYWIEVPFRKMLVDWWQKMKPDWRWSIQANSFECNEGLKIIFYYICFFGLNAWFLFLVFQGVIGLLPVQNNKAEDMGFRIFKWSVTLGLPALLFNLVGHMRWPAVKRVQIPELADMVQWDESENAEDAVSWKGVMHVRLVTRGKNPNLVLRNAETCVRVLKASDVPESRWRVEICTDNALYIQQRSDEPIDEILVPHEYRCPRGGKYKARALHYGAQHWPTGADDWIIHLDEETRFDANTVRHLYHHCSREHRECASGMKKYPNIGQGVILYGVGQTIDNYFTCLADCIRVADDFGKFRLQYENHSPWIGMHGSFVVCPWRIEKEFGFDHGLAGSITEDAYFALVVWEQGVRFSWIDAYMYEQSPFTALDFIRQRARWFGGLYLVVKDDEHTISFSKRFTLGMMTLTWAMSPLICIAMVTCLIIQTNISTPFRIFLALASSLSCWGYILGYVMTFRPSEGGWMRYFCLFYCTLVMQQFFAVCEISGILHTLYRHPSKGFFIVQKEAGGNFSNSDIAAITEQDVEKERQIRKGSLLSQVSEHSSVHSVRSRSRSQDFRSFRKLSTGSATSRHSYRSTPVQAAGHPDYDGLLAARRAAGYQSSLRHSARDELNAPLLGARSGSMGGASSTSNRSQRSRGPEDVEEMRVYLLQESHDVAFTMSEEDILRVAEENSNPSTDNSTKTW